jgi:uroporphyrinogen decarboxylase
MEVFTQTIIDYIAACKEIGIDGFFFATTQWGTFNRLSKEEYAEFARPYDLQVLEALQDSALLIFHVCKSNNMLLDLADYPVQVFNWADTEDGNPSIGEFREAYPDKTILGGISRALLAGSLPDAAVEGARKNLEITSGERWIAAPDCSIPPDAPPANIRAVVDFLRVDAPL